MRAYPHATIPKNLARIVHYVGQINSISLENLSLQIGKYLGYLYVYSQTEFLTHRRREVGDFAFVQKPCSNLTCQSVDSDYTVSI